MGIMEKLFNKMKDRKGLTGADIAAAITIIVLTMGVVTVIYINAINKSKDNLRYANAVRIATNIIENIQANTFETLTGTCNSTVNGVANSVYLKGNNTKIFETKIPAGFEVTVTAAKPAGPVAYDIARDVTVSVKYKASMTHKTITLRTVKEMELMDMTNAPDLSTVPHGSGEYVYPIKKDPTNTNYVVTTTTDINWYNYDTSARKYALVCKTNSKLNVGDPYAGDIYVWVPRFTSSGGLKYLYGTSNYTIVFDSSSTLFRYKKSNTSVAPTELNAEPYFKNNSSSGFWYKSGDGGDKLTTYNKFKNLLGTTNTNSNLPSGY